ncbi:MAG: hypothetical protein Sapg2KO_46820 [Saprospiraceae bacterium]
MQRLLKNIILLLLPVNLLAQNSQYFQQEVDYDIQVNLNDELHVLEGTIEIRYQNNSPDTLSEVIMHLWPNAYLDTQTAFAKQQLQDGSTTFHFAKSADRGFIDRLEFTVNGIHLEMEPWEENVDIAILSLKESLLPGHEVLIRSPFRVKIPASFSRLGHIETSYQISQWYPKPAVYDQAGWHPMPYLDRGEFYSEFGSYQVSITLPENYVVAATGELVSPEEQTFLSQKIKETQAFVKALDTSYYELLEPFPASALQRKTLVYKAEKVHDFAWFADKRFKVLADTLYIEENRKVACLAFFTNEEAHLWKDAPRYLKRALKFYSEALGAYPYPQMTAVESIESAGGGMEYPMVTLIGESILAEELDAVITHEVGHNWLQGILAFNERAYPWMDEGLNTYFEQLYLQQNYGTNSRSPLLPPFFQGNSSYSATETIFYYQSRQQLQQSLNTSSEALSETNYWLNAYDLPAHAFRHLETYLGRTSFSILLKGFYQKWQFRHPGPADFKKYLQEKATKDIQWFFDLYFNEKPKPNYKIQKAHQQADSIELYLKNKGVASPPFLLQIKNQNKTNSLWLNGFQRDTTFQVAISDFESMHLDPYHQILETNLRDNHYFNRQVFPKLEQLQLQLFPKLENDIRTSLTIVPTAGYNKYDGLLMGATWTNISYLPKAFEFSLSPLYGENTQQWLGTGLLRTDFLTKENRAQLRFQLNARRFHYANNPRDLHFTQFQPKLTWYWPATLSSTLSPQVSFGANFVREQQSKVPKLLGKDHRIQQYYLDFQLENQAPLFNQKLKVEFRQERLNIFNEPSNFTKFLAEWKGEITYGVRKSIFIRSYLGLLLSGPSTQTARILPNAFNAQSAGWNDYAYVNNYFARKEDKQFLAQQFHLSEGAFKLPLVPFSSLGRSNDLLWALNIKADVPFWGHKLPLRPYIDLVYSRRPSAEPSNLPKLIYGAGITVDFWKDRIAIHFPIFWSKTLQSEIESFDPSRENRYYSREISFVINLQNLKRDELLSLW